MLCRHPGHAEAVARIAWCVDEAAIGVITGLVINIAIFPPLQLRPAEYAVRQWGNGIADALDFLADAVTAPGESGERWPQHDDQLTTSAQQARSAARHVRSSASGWRRSPSTPRDSCRGCSPALLG